MDETAQGEVYQAGSGQWAWRVFDVEGDICRGAGYESEEDAEADMLNELSQLA